MSNEPRPPSLSLRLTFEGGTILIEGLPEGDSLGLPGVRFDPRAGMHRAEAIHYRFDPRAAPPDKSIHFTSTRSEGLREDPLAVPGRQAGVPPPDRGAGGLVEGEGRGVVVLPTGTGKTHLANLAINQAGRPSLVVTPTIDLLNQWFDELSLAFGVDVGILGGGYYDVKPLTVTTYDSAYQNVERLGNKFGLIVFDECHHLPSPTVSASALGSIAPVPAGPDRHARAGRQRPRAARPPHRADRLPPRDHPAQGAVPRRIHRRVAVRQPDRRGAAIGTSRCERPTGPSSRAPGST